MALAAVAGLVLGGLVGLLVGLSASPLVGQVMGLLTTVGVAFLGLRATGGEKGEKGDAAAATAAGGFAPARLAALIAFCLGCGFAVLTGLHLRTHGALSPSPVALKQELVALGMSEAEATQLVVARIYGTAKGGAPSGEAGTATTFASVLFADEGEDAALQLGPDHRPESYDRRSLEALWRSRGGRWAAYVASLADLDLDDTTFLAACGRFHRAQLAAEASP